MPYFYSLSLFPIPCIFVGTIIGIIGCIGCI
jgi:hypothetical protein